MSQSNLHFLQNFNYPKTLLAVFSTLQTHKHLAYLVGGCVRDILLGNTPIEFDIAVSALPEEIENMFPLHNSQAKKYGCISITQGQDKYELTTFRLEDEYKDKRHPATVIFTTAIQEDLKRRDFTINAMAYNPLNQQFIDLFKGQEDLASRLIRCIGEAENRFFEDTLRVLRAIRLAAQLDFTIEKNTLEAITPELFKLGKLSQERQQWELNKILLTSKPEIAYNYLFETNLLKEILPEFATLYEKPWAGISKTPCNLITRLNYLLRSLTIEDKKQLLTRLRYTKKMIKQVINSCAFPIK